MTAKKYPWSARRYAKDVEYMWNYLYCTINDEDKIQELGIDKIREMENFMNGPLADLKMELVGACAAPHGVVWLTGSQIGTAKQATIWAEEARAEANANF